MTKSLILLTITFVSLILIFCIPPIAQTPEFHNFADTRSLLGIVNAGNVLSNIPFLIIGIYGLVLVSRSPSPFAIRAIYAMLFVGVLLTGLGSAYYHWDPNNDRLVWDRIPMTIVFMSFLAATITELASRKVGVMLLLPLVALGIASVLWWHYTETAGKGDLRLYFWVQFYPMLAIPLLLLLYYKPTIKAIIPSLIWIVVWYVIAKIFEQLDFQIYHAIAVSGHTLKHLAAAASTGYFVHLYRMKYLTSGAAVVAA
ncbi:ceramidase domain-containing protein [Puia sp.]|jgi:hypothetical protein|uniref:ceramidase domain-containing protein n=1 Tax=Puia sp. TaxID=2045100 RepID=UPI002F414E51